MKTFEMIIVLEIPSAFFNIEFMFVIVYFVIKLDLTYVAVTDSESLGWSFSHPKQ